MRSPSSSTSAQPAAAGRAATPNSFAPLPKPAPTGSGRPTRCCTSPWFRPAGSGGNVAQRRFRRPCPDREAARDRRSRLRRIARRSSARVAISSAISASRGATARPPLSLLDQRRADFRLRGAFLGYRGTGRDRSPLGRSRGARRHRAGAPHHHHRKHSRGLHSVRPRQPAGDVQQPLPRGKRRHRRPAARRHRRLPNSMAAARRAGITVPAFDYIAEAKSEGQRPRHDRASIR